jgi:hypothetical protein
MWSVCDVNTFDVISTTSYRVPELGSGDRLSPTAELRNAK